MKKNFKRIKVEDVEFYNKIILTQPLAHDTYLRQTYDKEGKRWRLTYSSTSIHHVCPYDGIYRNCKDCGALEEDFDVKFCINKMQFVSTAALIERIIDCKKAGLEVEFLEEE